MPKAKNIPELTDEEEARIQAGIAQDPDNPELTDEQMAAMRPASEVLPPDLYAALVKHRKSRESLGPTVKEEVTILLDRAVLDHFRATGPDWQSRINETLKEAIGIDISSAGHPQAG